MIAQKSWWHIRVQKWTVVEVPIKWLGGYQFPALVSSEDYLIFYYEQPTGTVRDEKLIIIIILVWSFWTELGLSIR